MKQFVAILTAVILFSACGNSNTKKCENCTDSTSVVADSTSTDSTSIAVDTTSVVSFSAQRIWN